MMLKIVCAWCSKTLSEKDCEYLDENLPRITHSICPECYSKVLDDLNQADIPSIKDKLQFTIERRS